MKTFNVARRSLVKTLPLLACSPFLVSPFESFATPKAKFLSSVGKIKPGVQLYSVREDLKSSSFDTFKRLTKLGYKHVEWFDISTLSEQGEKAQKAGLEITSVHVLSPFLTGNHVLAKKHGLIVPQSLNTVESIAELLQRFIIKFLVLSYLFEDERQTISQYQKLAKHLQRAGKICRDYGIQLCYHNHEFELMPLDGQVPMEVLLQNTSADLVKLELDIYWLKYAGLEPADYIRRLGQRVSLLHLKDLSFNSNNQAVFAPLGTGEIDLIQIIAAAEHAGVEMCFVEQDQSSDIWRDLEISYHYLQTLMS